MATDTDETDDYQTQEPSTETTRLDSTGEAQHKSFPNEPSSLLHTSWLIVLLASCYAGAAVFAWAATCISTVRPIFADSYEYKVMSRLNTPDAYVKSERFLKMARVVGTTVSVITIPLTSAICAQAAVVFLQQPRRSGQSPTLRQSMALADKSWNNPMLIFKLVTGKWSKYGSRFLAAAILLNILGITMAPLQETFVSYKPVKRTSSSHSLWNNLDLTKAFENDYPPEDVDNDFVTLTTSGKLISTNMDDAQPRLWSGDLRCNSTSETDHQTKDLCAIGAGQYSFKDIEDLKNPFWAALPAGFNTGLTRQYMARFNCSVKAEQITSDSFPSSCYSDPQALHLYYNKTSSSQAQYSLRVCMPGNTTQSPWKPQRSRQDFREQLFLSATFSGLNGSLSMKITFDTTAGYFEVPNYMNGQVAGPLLDDDPRIRCQADDKCPEQFHHSTRRGDSQNVGPDWTSDNTTWSAGHNLRKGPLLNLAMALFGRASFLGSAFRLLASNVDSSEYRCLQIQPMFNLFSAPSRPEKSCILKFPLDPVLVEADYVDFFFPTSYRNNIDAKRDISSFEDEIDIPVVEKAFTAAALLAIDGLIISQPSVEYNRLIFDMGADTLVPVMSPAAMAFISAQLCLFLGSLLAMALYSALKPRWTLQLDAFAMMGIGAHAAEKFPLLVTRKVQEYSVLDQMPGWIGDAMGDQDEINSAGQLELGALLPGKGARPSRWDQPFQ
ncbi:hypothetical protein CDD81_3600 [Ophiocordyceps australis]|uniref:Uncharacterized protein n=1 Tax=Ophiocordyceps australis TaxID=1399860 RepID=A0A2C5YBG4_9HYPO|nr:hypothetical protein CDD81_3600 [Ophiocordyceps australis]